MLKWIGYLLIVALIAAFATSPSEKDFKKFAYAKMDTVTCKPAIYHKDYKVLFLKLFTISSAKECKEMKPLRNLQTNEPLNSKVGIGVYGKEETYLGLFGKFWKL